VLTNDTLFVDLLKGCGAVLCRVEVDCQSRVANPSAGRVLIACSIRCRHPAANDSPKALSMLA
jgi:hypothetical protein